MKFFFLFTIKYNCGSIFVKTITIFNFIKTCHKQVKFGFVFFINELDIEKIDIALKFFLIVCIAFIVHQRNGKEF